MLGSRDRHTTKPSTSLIGRLVFWHQQRAAIWVIKNYDRIEFLTFGFMHRHHMDTVQLGITGQNLLFSESRIECHPGLLVIAHYLPPLSEATTNAATSLKS